MRALRSVSWILMLLAAAAALVVLVYVALHRLGYPYELEWIEGSMADHVRRLRAGEDLYVAPSTDFVAALYTPLFYYLSAVVSFVTDVGFLPLRLTSLLASLACAWLIGLWIVKTHGSRPAAAVAAGVFLGGYGLADSWYDVAHRDTVFLSFALLSAYTLQRASTASSTATLRTPLVAGTWFCLAFLSKQTALALWPALVLCAACRDRRLALRFAATSAAMVLLVVAAYHRATDGWFTFFVFQMTQGHPYDSNFWLGFWTTDGWFVLPAFGLGLVYVTANRAAGWHTEQQRVRLFFAVLALGLLGTSYLSRPSP